MHVLWIIFKCKLQHCVQSLSHVSSSRIVRMNEYTNRASLVHRIDIDKPVIPMKRGLIPSSQRKTSRSTTVESLALLSRRAITKSTAQMGGQNVMKRLLSRCERSWAASSSYRGGERSSPMRPDAEVNITEWPPSRLHCCSEVQRARVLFDRELVVKFDCPGMFSQDGILTWVYSNLTRV